MSAKTLQVAGISALVVLLVLLLRSGLDSGASPASKGPGDRVGPTARPAASGDAAPASRSASFNPRAERAGTHSAVEDADQQFSRRQTALILTNAVRCVALIDDLIAAVPAARQNTRRQLEGMREKLFADDWRLAALHDPSLDPDAAEMALEHLGQQPEQADYESLRRLSADGDDDHDGGGIERLTAHYERLLSSRNPAYAEISTLLDAYTQNPGDSLHSDLFKDAATYVAMRSQLNGWWEEDRRLYRGFASEVAAERQVAAGAIPSETFDALDAFHERAAEEVGRGFEAQLSATDQVFAWRFREIHGLDSEALMAALSKLELSNATGLDLSVPGP